MITVPIDFSRQTYEDPSIVSLIERKKHFGEEEHVRLYGYDFADRLKNVGFYGSVGSRSGSTHRHDRKVRPVKG